MNSELTSEQITILYKEWALESPLVQDLSSYYLLYWDRIYFNNYIPYIEYPQTFPRSMTHNGIRYFIQIFESYPGEWNLGLEQSSRISLSFRSGIDQDGMRKSVVLIKAATRSDIV